jgi:hypothetical protein
MIVGLGSYFETTVGLKVTEIQVTDAVVDVADFKILQHF